LAHAGKSPCADRLRIAAARWKIIGFAGTPIVTRTLITGAARFTPILGTPVLDTAVFAAVNLSLEFLIVAARAQQHGG